MRPVPNKVCHALASNLLRARPQFAACLNPWHIYAANSFQVRSPTLRTAAIHHIPTLRPMTCQRIATFDGCHLAYQPDASPRPVTPTVSQLLSDESHCKISKKGVIKASCLQAHWRMCNLTQPGCSHEPFDSAFLRQQMYRSRQPRASCRAVPGYRRNICRDRSVFTSYPFAYYKAGRAPRCSRPVDEAGADCGGVDRAGCRQCRIASTTSTRFCIGSVIDVVRCAM
jgi:hypothetical protein